MAQGVRRALLLLCGLIGLAGCSISDEGATDFRAIGSSGELQKNFVPSPATRAIEPGTPLLITLKTAYIKDFTEFFGNPFRMDAGPNGEIAIVANVFEDDGATALDFGPAGLQNARVVFYSDDVHKGQFLNFHGLPLYGPLTYRGFPVVIDLYVIDLDRPGPQLRQILSNLAKLGSIAYPPGTPIAGALAQLAGTLITDDQDDKAFHFTLVQRPAGGAPGVPYSVLEAGHVVFVREQARSNTTDWTKLRLNTHAGVLVKDSAPACINSAAPPPGCLYRDNTYLVVEVNTAPTALTQDRQRILFSALRQDVASQSAPIAQQALPESALNEIAQRLAQTERADRARRALDALETAPSRSADANAAASAFVATWFSGPNAFTAEQEEQLLRRVGRRLAGCGADPTQLIGFTDALRSHDPNAPRRAEIARALVC